MRNLGLTMNRGRSIIAASYWGLHDLHLNVVSWQEARQIGDNEDVVGGPTISSVLKWLAETKRHSCNCGYYTTTPVIRLTFKHDPVTQRSTEGQDLLPTADLTFTCPLAEEKDHPASIRGAWVTQRSIEGQDLPPTADLTFTCLLSQ